MPPSPPIDPGTPPPGTTDHAPLTLAVLGLGEVGRIYATALFAAGHIVTGHDPFHTQSPPGVPVADSLERAVSGADLVLTLTGAAASLTVARSVVDALPVGAVYADFTSSAPEAKRSLQDVFATRPDVRLVDVAILGPVVQAGPSTPLMAAGPAAHDLARLMRALGADVEIVDGSLGDAMAHKLLRSVFMKSLAAAVTEAVHAGRAAGHERWIRRQIARELAGNGQQTIDRFLRGTVLHAFRRSQEMDAASAYLRQLGVSPTMSEAAAALHRELLDPLPADSGAPMQDRRA